MNDLTTLEQGWQEAAETMPYQSILADCDNADLDGFFERGRRDIAQAMGWVDELKLKPGHVALDFGCGAGRCTLALKDYFMTAFGVDISANMIALAKVHDEDAECRFLLNRKPNLRLFEDGLFDFIYTNLVLQHMEPKLQRAYIREFGRVLRPGGVAVVGLCDGQPYDNPKPYLSMFPASQETVTDWLAEGRLWLKAVAGREQAGGFIYNFYVASKSRMR